jgi:hypothetical protein
MRPNTRIDAAQPQKECGQPAGRPPTIRPLSSTLAIWIVVALPVTSRGARMRNAVVRTRMFEPEKSQGMVTLHSGGAARWDRKGRAPAAVDEIAIMKATLNAT